MLVPRVIQARTEAHAAGYPFTSIGHDHQARSSKVWAENPISEKVLGCLAAWPLGRLHSCTAWGPLGPQSWSELWLGFGFRSGFGVGVGVGVGVLTLAVSTNNPPKSKGLLPSLFQLSSSLTRLHSSVHRISRFDVHLGSCFGGKEV